MAVYVELVTDAFVENFQRMRDRNDPAMSRSGRAGLVNVRRPLRGIEIKEDTYACLKVLRADGSELPFMDSSASSGQSTTYSNFILQSVQEQRMEKHQIVETFGDPYLFLFGEAPRFLDVTAILLNSNDFNWEAEWWANWENTLRGSKSVENGARTYLFYDDNIVEGYMLMAQAQKISTEPIQVSMSFRLFVSSLRNVSSIGDPNFPVAESVFLPPDVSLTSGDAFQQLHNYYEANNGYLSPGQANSWMDNVVRASDPRQFGTGARLVDLLKRGTRAIAFPSSVQSYIDEASPTLGVQNVLGMYDSKPIRSLIADNADEYTGFDPQTSALNSQLPEVYDPRVRGQLEVENLFQSAIRWMGCFGANINSYNALNGLGMGINFLPSTGIGIGVGGSAGSGIGATFGSIPAGGGIGFGVNARSGIRGGMFSGPGTYGSAQQGMAANGFGMQQVGQPVYSPGQLYAYRDDVLFSTGLNNAGQGQLLRTSYGDPTYGYAGPYGGAGYGQTGFGDYGGLGYGSSFGATGDPGFLPPSAFSQAGVADVRSDFQRLIAPKPGFGSGFGGVPAGASFAGAGAGASVSVGGSISAFSIFAAPGTLNPNGNALTATGRRLGLTERNPFGVPCMGNGTFKRVNLLDMI